MNDPRHGPRREGNPLTLEQWSTLSHTRLHLGCGYTILDGYVNIDAMKIPNIDIRLDMTSMALPFPNETVHEIFMADVLEHIHKKYHAFVLGEWSRVLIPGGTIQIIGPNFEVLALSLIADSRQIDLPEDAMKTYFISPFEHYEAMSTAILSDQYDSAEESKYFHHWNILTGPYVVELLRRHGFSRAEVIQPWPPTEFNVKGVK